MTVFPILRETTNPTFEVLVKFLGLLNLTDSEVAGPSGRGPLFVGVDQKDVVPVAGQLSGDIHRKSSFANTTLLIQKGDNHKTTLPLVRVCVKPQTLTLFAGLLRARCEGKGKE